MTWDHPVPRPGNRGLEFIAHLRRRGGDAAGPREEDISFPFFNCWNHLAFLGTNVNGPLDSSCGTKMADSCGHHVIRSGRPGGLADDYGVGNKAVNARTVLTFFGV